MKSIRRFLLNAFLAFLAVLDARADGGAVEVRQFRDEQLVRYERALSQARRENPGDAEIARRHDEAARAALARARERVEAREAALLRVSAAAKKIHRIGYVASVGGPTFEAFGQGMREAGLVEGRDFVLESRFTEGRTERFPRMVDELLEARVDVLLAGSPPGAVAALKAETTTPIVIAGVTDPHGVARSIGRPYSHVTGTSVASRDVGGHWVEILKQASPRLTRVAVLVNPGHFGRARWMADINKAAEQLGVQVVVHEAADAPALDRALAAISDGSAQGLIVTGDPVFLVNRAKIIGTVERCGLPAVYFSKIFADSGGLLAYGGSLEDSYRMAPRYIARILAGAVPAELPIEDTRVELVVNKRSAATLGIVLPDELVRRADKVID